MWQPYRKITIVIALALNFSLAKNSCANVDDDLIASSDKLRFSFTVLGRLIGSKGDAELLRLYDSTSFSVIRAEFPNVGVDRTGPRPKIAAAAEYHLLLTYIADTNFAIMNRPEYANCGFAYNLYLARELRRIVVPPLRGKHPRLMAPEEFGSERLDICTGFAQLFPIPTQQRPARDGAVNSAVIFVLLHELAHVARNHQWIDFEVLARVRGEKEKMERFLALSKQGRRQEDDADMWAVDKMVQLGATPSDIFNSTLIGGLTVYSGVACWLEPAEDHSNGVFRVEKILQRFLKKYKESGSTVDSRLLDITQSFQRLTKKMRSQLECAKAT